MAGLAQMVERARGRLAQYVVDRPQMATFGGLSGDQMTLTPIQGFSSLGGSALLEIGHELIQMSNFDADSNIATIPDWGRAQMGTTQVTPTIGDRVIINPLWPYWHVSQALIDGMRAMYPALFSVKNVELTTETLTERYELPDDAEHILDMRIEWYAPTQAHRPITHYSVDISNTDGKRYLHIRDRGVSGRPIFVTYRAAPVLPDGPDDTDWVWADSGFPATAEDLPGLYAAANLIPSAEAARLQTFSSEQSDRSRFVQGGTANAASRRLEELFRGRLLEERSRLLDQYPPKIRHEFVG